MAEREGTANFRSAIVHSMKTLLSSPRHWLIYTHDQVVSGTWTLEEVLTGVAHYRRAYGILLFYLEAPAPPVMSRGMDNTAGE